jgi:hypothetical protein
MMSDAGTADVLMITYDNDGKSMRMMTSEVRWI